MIKFIKRAVTSVCGEHCDIIRFNAVSCMVVCDVNCNRLNSFDLAKIAKTYLNEFNKTQLTVLDFAEYYEKHGGNAVLFLRTYQDNFGQIE